MGFGICDQEPAQSSSPAPSMAAPFLLLLLFWGALPVPSAARPPAANASAAPTPTETVTVGVLLPEDLSYPWARPRVAPALSLALEALEPLLRLAGLAVRTAFASLEDEDGWCDQDVAAIKVTDLKCSHDPDVLLGRVCDQSRDIVKYLALHWQVPLLRAGIYLNIPKRDSSTEVYLGPAGDSLGSFQEQLVRHFNWTARAVVLTNFFSEYWHISSSPSFEDLPNFQAPSLEYGDPGEAVRLIQAKGRVVFIYGSLETFQEIMRLAQAQNMTNGDYVFFYVDIYGDSLRAKGHREAAKPWQSNETQNTVGLQEAFQTVLVITAHELQTPEYRHFQSQLLLRAQSELGETVNDSLGNLVAGCFHDGLLLYLRALNETLREGGTKRNTSRILEHTRGQKFQGVTGTVSINRNNDREMDFDLWAMRNVVSGEYQLVGHYIGSEKQINWLGPILWKKGAPPLDNPPCVFSKDDPSCGDACVTFW